MADFDLYLNPGHADAFLGLLMGGMARAQERYRDNLRTVDEHGNPIGEPLAALYATSGKEPA